MSNINPVHYLGGMNHLMAVQAGQRVYNQMPLAAMAQGQPNLNPAYNNYNLGFPTMLANINPRVAPMHVAMAQRPPIPKPPLNQGKGILRIMLFADYLGGEPNHPAKKDIMYWKRFVAEFFTEEGMMRYALWNSKTQEPRIFDIVNSVIPRYYQVNFDSGVTGIQLILGHAREHVFRGINGPAGHTVDCPRATMIYSYENGTRIVATGQLRVRMNAHLKIDFMDFTTKKHEEYIPRDVKETLPPSPVNDLGIPMKTLRSLEIAEGVAQLNELITVTLASNQGPRQTLQQLAARSSSDPPQHMTANLATPTPPTPGPSPPNEPVVKMSPKKEPETMIPLETVSNNLNNSNTNSSTSNTSNNDVPLSSPSPSIVKSESSTTPRLSTKSPRIGDKRGPESTGVNKPKRRNTKTSPKKGNRQDSAS